MAAFIERLQDAAFLADVTPEDRKLRRILLPLALWIFGVFAILAIVGVGLGIYLIAMGIGPDQMTEFLGKMQSPDWAPGFEETLGMLGILGVLNTSLLCSLVVIACLISKRPFRSYVTAARRFRWRMMLVGMGLFFAVLAPAIAIGAWLDPDLPTYPVFRLAEAPEHRLLLVVMAFVCLIPAAFAEEVVFRGWLLKHTAAYWRNVWFMLLINGAIFSFIHYPDIGPSAFLARLIMGAGFCYMTLRLGGIEFATGAHAANNIFLLLFIMPMTVMPDPDQKFVPLMLGGAVVEVAGYVLITEIVLHWRRLRE